MYKIKNKTNKTLSLDEGIKLNGKESIELETLSERIVYLERNGFLVTTKLFKKVNKKSQVKEIEEPVVEEETQEIKQERN